MMMMNKNFSWMAPCSFLTTWTIGRGRRMVIKFAFCIQPPSHLPQEKMKMSGDVLECISLYNIENVTFSSSGVGTLDGNGETWFDSFSKINRTERNQQQSWTN